MVIDMPNKKYRSSYQGGGLLDELRQSSRTLTLGQRTKDKVARDLLRDEAELPPPMEDLGRASGGMVGLQNGGGIRRAYMPTHTMDRLAREAGYEGGWQPDGEGEFPDERDGLRELLGRGIGGIGRGVSGLGELLGRGARRIGRGARRTGRGLSMLVPPGVSEFDAALKERLDRGARAWDAVLKARMLGVGQGIASGGIVGLNRGGRIPKYAFGGAWGGGQQGGVQQGGGWQGVKGGGGWQGGQQQQGGGWGTGGGGMGLKPLGQPSPGTHWGAAGGGSRSDPFLGNPQGFAQFQAQQGGGGQQGGQQQVGMGVGTGGGGWQGGQQQQGGVQPVLNAPGTGPGYQAQALPEGYGAPAQYAGYGGPAQMESRQEFVSPEVAQQYSDLTQGIMQVGTKPYEQYQGPQLASFSPMEAAAQAGYGAYGTSAGPQGTIQAQSTLDAAAGGMGTMVPKYKTLGTQYQTAGTGMKTLADTSAIAQRGYGTAADTATDTSLKLQRATGLEDYATKSAKEQRALGADLGDPTLQKGADLSGYMSQYTKGVTDPQLQQLMEFQKMQGQELGSQAAAAGAFGGLRQGVQAATQAQDVSQQAADIIGKSQQEAFQSAQAAQAADVARTQAGQQAELAAERGALAAETGQQAAQLSAEQQALQQQMQQEQFGAGQEQTAHQAAMAGRQANLAAMKAQQGAMGDEMGAYKGIAGIGGQQMTLGQQQQSQQMQRLAAMKQAGAGQRQLQQAALDIQKQQWEQQQQQPERQIAWMNQQLGALPYQNIVQQGTYTPQAGAVSNLLGAGIQGAGLWNAWQGRQRPGSQGPSNLQRMAMNAPIPEPAPRQLTQPGLPPGLFSRPPSLPSISRP